MSGPAAVEGSWLMVHGADGRRLRGLVVTVVLTLMFNGAWAADPARALDLPAGDPQLAVLARDLGVEALRAAVADAQPERRRGAARLLATGIVPPAELLPLLLSCADPEVRRLGAFGLRRAALPVADLLKLGDARVVAPLLSLHPDPWAGGVARPAVLAWLKDPAVCADAAALLVARGDLAAWGDELAKLLEAPASPEPVVAAAHLVLERLTATQRNREMYAGSRDLLAKDWRDALAARAERPAQVDPALLVLVAELPAPSAVEALLARGPAALPALEQALAGADRARRKVLQPVARLAARGVTPYLWKTLGEDGFADLDTEDVRLRAACLRRIAAAVRTGHDRAGLIHLVRWLDDSDSRLRASALDLLVRISDERKAFGDKWKLGDDQLFPAGQTLWRLRRSLRDGGRDERLAALLFAGSLEATVLADDAAGLLIDADPVVAEAALDALGHLKATEAHLPALVRIAQDQALPPTRRALACTRIAGMNSGDDYSYVNGKRVFKAAGAQTVAAREALRTLLDDPLPTIATAAAKALLKIDKSPNGRKGLYTKLASSGRAAVLKDALDDEEDSALLVGLLPYLAHEDESALALASGLVKAIEGTWDRPTKNRLALKTPITAAASRPEATLPERIVGLVYGIRRSEMLASFATLPEVVRPEVWQVLVSHAPRNPAALIALAPLAALVPSSNRSRLVGQAWTVAALESQVFLAMIKADQLTYAVVLKDDRDYEGELRTRSIVLDEGLSVRLTAAKKSRGSDDDEDLDWTLIAPPPGLAQADAIALRAALASLELEDDHAHLRPLVLAALGGDDPELTPRWTDELGAWAVLIRLRPALRPALIAGVLAVPAGEISEWQLRPLIEAGNPDLLPLVAARWGTTDDWQRRQLSTWMLSLKATELRSQLATLVATDAGRDAKETAALVRRAAPIPLAAALRLLSAGKLTVAVESFTDATALTTALSALTPEAVLAQTGGLAALRSAGPEAFDAALATLCAKPDRTGAAWLRTGLPLQHLGRAPYDAAFAGDEPHRWVVGAALQLKEGNLTSAEFLANLPSLPPTALADALAAAKRRLEGKTADQGQALAAILLIAPASDVAVWLELCPPDAAVGEALKTRLKAGLPAALLAPALAARLRQDRPSWEPLIQDLDQAAGGHLTKLLRAVTKSP